MSHAVPHLTFTAGTLLLEGYSCGKLYQVFGRRYWRWDQRVGCWRCDALDYAAVRKALEARGETVSDRVPGWQCVQWPRVQLPLLRPEQVQAVEAWNANPRGLLVMATGTGKSEVALAIMKDMEVSTLVVAPVRDLMYQWRDRIGHGLGHEAGIIGDGQFGPRPVSVTTYDSARIHMDRLGNRFGLIVFDECHHLPGEAWRESALMSAAPFRLGLTATLERNDGKHADLTRLIGPLLFHLSLPAVRGKTLANYEVVRIPVFLSRQEQSRYDSLAARVRNYVAKQRKSQPGFSWQDLCQQSVKDPWARKALDAYWEKKTIEDRAEEKLRVLEDLFRLHAGSSILVFAGSNAMARDISRRFLIPCLLHHCQKEERLEILQGFREGGYPALVANQVLDEGVDVPEVKVAVVVGGTASARQAKQRLGRLLRKSGNRSAILYEVVCAGTRDEQRSRRRRHSDAYQRTRHRPL